MQKRFCAICSLLFLLGFSFWGCAGMSDPQRVTAEIETASKQFNVDPGMARIYIIRPSKFAAQGVYICPTINQMVTGILYSGTYLVLDVPPGEYVFSGAGDVDDPGKIVLTTEADQLYFLQMYFLTGINPVNINSPGLVCERLDPEEGKRLVLEYKQYISKAYAPSQLRQSQGMEGNIPVHFVRPVTFFGAMKRNKFSPTVDDRVVGFLERDGCVSTMVSPGHHVLSVAGRFEGNYATDLEAFPGEEYFIKITPSMGMAYTKLTLKVVDPKEGGNLVQNCQQRE